MPNTTRIHMLNDIDGDWSFVVNLLSCNRPETGGIPACHMR